MREAATSARAMSNEIALQMTPVVRRIARKLAARLPSHVSIDDLIGAGFVGLLTAYQHFDPAQAEDFQSYAEPRVRGAMLDAMRASDPLSRTQRAQARHIASAVRALAGRLGRTPEDAEVAAELGIPLEDYMRWSSVAQRASTVSLDDEILEAASFRVGEVDAAPADERLSDEEARRAVREAIALLPPRLRQVLTLYYDRGLALRDIGVMFGVTESRVCQLHAEAIARLRERCAEHIPGAEGRPSMRRRRSASVRIARVEWSSPVRERSWKLPPQQIEAQPSLGAWPLSASPLQALRGAPRSTCPRPRMGCGGGPRPARSAPSAPPPSSHS